MTHGILFSAPMALANVNGTKGQTRRLLPSQPPEGFLYGGTVSASTDKADLGKHVWYDKLVSFPKQRHAVRCKWQVGDTIYQKETFFRDTSQILYRADEWIIGCHHWTPSIFMPREASRFTATITEIRVQRLDEITEADAIAEGIREVSTGRHTTCFEWSPQEDGQDTARDAYRHLWNSIHLAPSPIYGHKDPATNRRPIIAYVSYPWSMADFEKVYPHRHTTGSMMGQTPTYRGLPLHIHTNPWLFAISYKKF